MNLVQVIRHKYFAEKLSIRAIARELQLSRNTVKRYLLDSTTPGVRSKDTAPSQPVRAPAREKVQALLTGKHWTAKQRPTSNRIAELLELEGVTASGRTVRRILSEENRKKKEVFVPLIYAAGDLAEVDFFEIHFLIAGETQKGWIFLMRCMGSGRDFAWIYRWQDTACLLDGHLRAFRHFGALPCRILYDNLKPAVKRLIGLGERRLTDRFAAFAAHFCFEPCFARPAQGHDKGGVEARGKGVRLANLSPLPEKESLLAINEELLRRLDRPFLPGAPGITRWSEDRAKMLPLPVGDHDPSLVELCTVGRNAMVRVAGALYSVPCGWHSLTVKSRCYAEKVVFQQGEEQVEHQRVPAGQKSVWYPHYLPELVRKPNALAQVASALMPQLGDPFPAFWTLLYKGKGRLEAARSFKEVLRVILESGLETARRAVVLALKKGASNLLEIRKGKLEEYPGKVPANLASVKVENRGLAHFDQLLGGGQ